MKHRSYLLPLLFGLLPATLSAAPITFTLDSSQSYMTLGLFFPGGEVFTTPQTPLSDTSPLSGTIPVDVTPTTLQFLGGADINFAYQPEPQSPLIGGFPGTSPAQFGLAIDIPNIVTGTVAARNYMGEATSDVIPRVGDTFDGTQVFLTLLHPETAYNVTILGQPYSGDYNVINVAPNLITGSTLNQQGDLYTLTLPYYIEGYFAIGGIDVAVQYAGNVVATALVPEPSTATLTAFIPCLRRLRAQK